MAKKTNNTAPLAQKVTTFLDNQLFQADVLSQIRNITGTTYNLKDMLPGIFGVIDRVIDYDMASIVSLDPEDKTCLGWVSRTIDKSFLEDFKKKASSVLRQQGASTPFKLTRSNIKIAPGRCILEKNVPKSGARSFLHFPLKSANKAIGIITVGSSKSAAFDAQDRKLLMAIAKESSSVIANTLKFSRLMRELGAFTKKLDEANRENARAFANMKSMVESMLEGIIMVNESGRLVILNPTARRMLGFTTAEETTQSEFSKRLKAAKLDEALKQCRQNKTQVTKEVILPQEKTQILRCDITPAKDTTGAILGTVVILNDITRQKAIDRMKTEFISTVSHEMRTPLGIMREDLSQILDDITGPINDEQKDILTSAMGNIDRLERIINSLLDVSKIESGRTAGKIRLVDLSSLIKGISSTFKTAASDKGLSFKVTLPKVSLSVFADADGIVQIFTNLIANAVKFTQKGSIEVSAVDRKNEVICAVKDTGVGISKDDLTRAFERFQQFGRTFGAGEKGTGLGLFITKGIVEKFGGKIWAESKKDKGSTFFFSLPKAHPQQLFEEYTKIAIEQAAKLDSEVSFIMVTAQGVNATVKQIEDKVKMGIRQTADVVLRKKDEILVVLYACGRPGVRVVEDRLKKALGSKLNAKFKHCSYPADSPDAVKLLKMLRG